MAAVHAAWPNQWFGFYGPDPVKCDSEWEWTRGIMPGASELMDVNWHPADFERIIAYLVDAPMVVFGMVPPVQCRRCVEDFAQNLEFHYDGEWLWPISLVHDVTVHHVRLPDRMVNHIRQRAYEPPEFVDFWPEKLPWPPTKRKVDLPERSSDASVPVKQMRPKGKAWSRRARPE